MGGIVEIAKAIPGAATNVYGAIAIVAVAAAWLLATLRVQRSKNLLAKLKDLPEDQRAVVLQAEMGTYVGKMTPRQFMAWKNRQYILAGYITTVVAAGIVLIVALLHPQPVDAGNQAAAAPSDAAKRDQAGSCVFFVVSPPRLPANPRFEQEADLFVDAHRLTLPLAPQVLVLRDALPGRFPLRYVMKVADPEVQVPSPSPALPGWQNTDDPKEPNARWYTSGFDLSSTNGVHVILQPMGELKIPVAANRQLHVTMVGEGQFRESLGALGFDYPSCANAPAGLSVATKKRT